MLFSQFVICLNIKVNTGVSLIRIIPLWYTVLEKFNDFKDIMVEWTGLKPIVMNIVYKIKTTAFSYCHEEYVNILKRTVVF